MVVNLEKSVRPKVVEDNLHKDVMADVIVAIVDVMIVEAILKEAMNAEILKRTVEIEIANQWLRQQRGSNHESCLSRREWMPWRSKLPPPAEPIPCLN